MSKSQVRGMIASAIASGQVTVIQCPPKKRYKRGHAPVGGIKSRPMK